MGIELVRLLLLRHAAELSGRAFKVLTYMASTALDQPNDKGQPARLYFAGEEPLALVLYGPADCYTANQLRELRRVVRELVDAGLIERTSHAGRGRRQTFRLNLSLGGATPHPNTTTLGGESAPSSGGEIPPRKGGDIPPQRVGELPTPRTDRGQTEDLPQDTTTPPPTTSTTGHAPATSHRFNPDQYDDECLDCGEKRLNTVHRRTA